MSRIFAVGARALALFAAAVAAVSALPVNSSFGAQSVTSTITDEPGRIPYQTNIYCSDDLLTCSSPGPVPQGHRLVVTHLSGWVKFSVPPNGSMVVIMNNFRIRFSSAFLVTVSGQTLAFDQPITAYVEGNDSFTINFLPATDKDRFSLDVGTVTVTGYLLNCTTQPCSPIAP